MSSAAQLQATLDLSEYIAADPRPLDAALSSWLRNNRTLSDPDRGAIIELTYAMLRQHARLGWWLDSLGAADLPRHRLLAFLAFDGKSLDQLNGLFSGGRLAPSPLTNDERAFLRKLGGAPLDHASMPLTVRVECPDWAIEPLQRRFGDSFVSEMQALLTPAPLDLRVNPLKSSRDAMLAELAALRLDARPLPMAPLGIRLDTRLSLASLPMLKTGALEIQDEGSQLVALLVDAKPGNRVVDFCAGAGGKTLAIAAQMANKGHVIACDVSEGRLKRAAERFRRAGLHNIETRLLSSETDRWVKRHKLGFDRVLVDAPCSGTGTWRRNPDARWRAEDQGLDALIALQAKILASAARLVKPGGQLVYATCSLLTEENEAQVATFLAAHPDFVIVPQQQVRTSAHDQFLSLTPAQHDTDGFFAAVLQRKTAVEPASA